MVLIRFRIEMVKKKIEVIIFFILVGGSLASCANVARFGFGPWKSDPDVVLQFQLLEAVVFPTSTS